MIILRVQRIWEHCLQQTKLTKEASLALKDVPKPCLIKEVKILGENETFITATIFKSSSRPSKAVCLIHLDDPKWTEEAIVSVIHNLIT